MNKLIETAKEIDRILKSGIEIHPNSPIHEKLQQALNIPDVSQRSELLAFIDWLEDNSDNSIDREWVDDYLKANCG